MAPGTPLTASMIAVIGAVAPLHTAGSAAGRSAEHAGRRRRRHLWRRDAEPGAGSARPHVRGVCVHRRQKRIRRPRQPARESRIQRRHERALPRRRTPRVEKQRYRALVEILLRQRPGEVGTSISGSRTDRAGLHGSVRITWLQAGESKTRRRKAKADTCATTAWFTTTRSPSARRRAHASADQLPAARTEIRWMRLIERRDQRQNR